MFPGRFVRCIEPATAVALQSHVTRLLPESVLRDAIPGVKRPSVVRGGDLLVGRLDHLAPGVSLLGRDGRALPALRGDRLLLCMADTGDPGDLANAAPASLGPGAWLDLVGRNGMVAAQHHRVGCGSALGRIRRVGFLVDGAGQAVRLPSVAAKAHPPGMVRSLLPEVVLCGSGVAALTGRSRRLAEVIAGFREAGRVVAVCRLNATGRGAPPADLMAAGALAVFDLVDAGCSRVGTLPLSVLERLCSRWFQDLALRGADLVLIEADAGLDQPEVSALLMSQWFRSRLSAVLMARQPGDDVASRCAWLDSLGLQVWTEAGGCTRRC